MKRFGICVVLCGFMGFGQPKGMHLVDPSAIDLGLVHENSTARYSKRDDTLITISGTIPNVSGALNGEVHTFSTSSGTSPSEILGFYSILEGDYSGSGGTWAAEFDNYSASSGNNYGIMGFSGGESSGSNVGIWGMGTGASTNIGGFFNLGYGANPTVSSALAADNTDLAVDIARFYDNSTVKVRIQDGGHVSTEAGVGLSTGGALKTVPPSLVNLTTTSTNVSVTGASYIRLSSDDATPSNRDFHLNQGSAGHNLTLEWVGTYGGRLVDDSANSDSGNVRLNGNWAPVDCGTLRLISNGTDWVEISRSVVVCPTESLVRSRRHSK